MAAIGVLIAGEGVKIHRHHSSLFLVFDNL